jgi:hypothetical protein
VYDDLAGKTLALLREAVPGITHVSVLWNPDHADPEYRETRRAAAALGIRLQSLEVRRASDFEGAFKLALAEHSQGLIIVPSRLMSLQRQAIAEFTARIDRLGGRMGRMDERRSVADLRPERCRHDATRCRFRGQGSEGRKTRRLHNGTTHCFELVIT